MGSTFRGKNQVVSLFEKCAACDRAVARETYRARRWVTVGGIPVLPREICHIVGQCPWCGDHTVLNEESWGGLRSRYESCRQSSEDAVAYHAALRTFGLREEADTLGAELNERFNDHVPTLLYLSHWRTEQGDLAAAGECVRRAVGLAPDLPAVQVAVGRLAIAERQPDRAYHWLSNVSPNSPDCSPLEFLKLAEVYRGQNRPNEARTILLALVNIEPELRKNGDVEKSIDECEQSLEIPLRLRSSRRSLWRYLRWGVAVSALLFAGWIGYGQYLARHYPIWIVNGTHSPLEVRFDDRDLTIPPMGRQYLETHEGRHRCELRGEHTTLPPMDFEVSQHWTRRYKSHPLCVLDPSGTAALFWQETRYVPNPDGKLRRVPYRIHLGDRLIQYDNVEYPFRDFPKTLSVRNDDRQGVRSRVDFCNEAPAHLLMSLFSDLKYAGDPLAFAERHLDANPDDSSLVESYAQVSRHLNATDHAREFLERRFDDQPPRLRWHEALQDLTTTDAGETALRKRYDARLEPGNADQGWIYLRGRMEPNLAISLVLCQKAPEVAAAWDLCAVRLHQAGRFDEAFERGLAAVARDSKDLRFQAHVTETRMASRDWKQMESELKEQLRVTPDDISLRLFLLQVQAAAGHPAQLDEIVIEDHSRTDEDNSEVQRVLELSLLDMRGEYEQLAIFAESTKDPEIRTQNLLISLLGRGKTEGLEKLGVPPLMPA
ncbi:MAG: hypothetical protein NT069_26305, partial [Planctomycetota bacterium]|nr:hypothetical protein [Planctomycetota bacterium]